MPIGRSRRWFDVRLTDVFSSWLLHAYRRPIGFLTGLVLLPTALIGGFAYWSSANLWREQTLHNLGVTARLAAEIIAETLDETVRFEQRVAAHPGFLEALKRRDRPHLAQYLDQALKFTPRVDLAMILSPEGQVVACVPDRPELIGRSVSEEDPFQGAQRAGGRPYVSSVYLREGPDVEKVVGVVFTIMQADRVVGFLQAQHRVETVKSWLQKLRVDPEGFLYVVDHQRQLVVYPFQVLPGRPKVVSHWPPVAHPLSPEGNGLVFLDGRSGQRWLAAIRPVRAIGWRVVAVQPERAAFQALRQAFWLLGLLVVLLIGVITMVVIRWAQLHAFSLRLMRQNTKLLKQMQQRRMFDRGGRTG
jgi:hypothetical protein